MSNGSYILLEDRTVKGFFEDKEAALAAMREEQKKDFLGLCLKKRLLMKFISGKYTLKRYMVVQVVHVKTLSSEDDLAALKEVF